LLFGLFRDALFLKIAFSLFLALVGIHILPQGLTNLPSGHRIGNLEPTSWLDGPVQCQESSIVLVDIVHHLATEVGLVLFGLECGVGRFEIQNFFAVSLVAGVVIRLATAAHKNVLLGGI